MDKFVFLFYFFTSLLFAQTTPQQGLSENKPAFIAYKNATIVSSVENDNTFNTIIVRDGRIENVGNDLKIPAGAKVVDLAGSFVYPGFIEPFSSYGMPKLKKAKKIKGPNPDIKRVGKIHWNAAVKAQRSAADEFVVDGKAAKEFIEQGFTIVQSNALDGFFQGSSVVVLLNEGLSNKLIIKDNTSQFLSFSRGVSSQDYPSSLMGAIALIRQTFYDAQWYKSAWQAYNSNPAQTRPEKNISLSALQNVMEKKTPVIFNAGNYLNVIRASEIASEFGVKFIYKTGTDSYKRINDVKKLNSTLIVPLNFPAVPNIASVNTDADVSLAQLKNWDIAPENPARLNKAGINFAFTSFGLKDKSDFLKNVRIAVKRGLDKKSALKALTTIPAKILGISEIAGTLEKGKLASFIVSDKDIFEEDAFIERVIIEKIEHKINAKPEQDYRGDWALQIKNQQLPQELKLFISGTSIKQKGVVYADSVKLTTTNFAIEDNQLSFNIVSDSLGIKGILRFNGRLDKTEASGKTIFPNGDFHLWQAKKIKNFEEESDDKEEKPLSLAASFPVTFPDKAYGRPAPPSQPEIVAVTNATIWTAAKEGILQKADIIIKEGKISAIGKNLSIPSDAIKIDGTGLHITPGIIDEHSHIAINGGVNEAAQAISSEVRIGDVLNPENINIYRQLAGGVTTSRLLHGSANPIGGQAQVIKLKWGENADGLKYKKAPPSIKFALGENVKQSNWGDNYNKRYPQTRMGVREIIWDAFKRAKEYEAEMKAFNDLSSSQQKQTVPPRKDLELDALLEILNHERFVTCHSYVQSEILMLMRLAEEYGFRIRTFTHILEGYKVAQEMAEHGAMAGTFSDWWDYKFEVYEAIPYNAALMAKQGVVTSVNSDDAEMARRLNQEAAKTIKYGGLSREEAIKLVTINPAKQLGTEKYTGSLEAGKDADFVIWNADPLSIYASVKQTWIEGRKYFDVEEDEMIRQQIKEQRAALIQKVMSVDNKPNKNGSPVPDQSKDDYRCDDLDIYNGGLE